MSSHLLEQGCSQPSSGSKERRLRTIHNEFHVAHKTMNNLKCLGPSHASLIDGESIKSMEHILDLALAQQFLCKLL